MMGFFTGPKIAFGPGAVEQITGLEPREVTLLVAPAVSRLDPVRRLLAWFEEFSARPAVVESSGSSPTVDEVERIDRAVAPGSDLLVAVGGGSLLDLAKAVRARRLRPDLPLTEWTPLLEVPRDASIRLVAIPTTVGSGSEMSGAAHLLDPSGDTREISHRSLAPEWALLDPEFARTLPGPEAVAEGAEAIAHAFEALASEWANPFSDAFARDAIALGIPALARLARQPRDVDPRSALYYAASRAGLAAANASLGLAHAFARALLPDVPKAGYARLLSCALPTVIEYNFPSKRDVYEGIAPLVPAGNTAVFEPFGARVASLLRSMGVPTDLLALGVAPDTVRGSKDRVARRVVASTSTVANPRVPSLPEAGRLLDSMLNGLPRRSP